MKTALILGGGGLIGRSLTTSLLADSRYAGVILLVRKPIDMIHEKLEQVLHNFDDPDISTLKGDEIFCCLGTTIKAAGSKQAFYKVDHNYILNTAYKAHQKGIKKFALVSSMGANSRSGVFYNKTKGQTEVSLTNIGFSSLFILRPSLLLGRRSELRLSETIAKHLMVNLSLLIPKKYKAIKGSQVAKAMVQLMNSDQEGTHILDSAMIAAI